MSVWYGMVWYGIGAHVKDKTMINGKLTVTCITRELGLADVGVTGDVMPACFCTCHVDNYVLNVTLMLISYN